MKSFSDILQIERRASNFQFSYFGWQTLTMRISNERKGFQAEEQTFMLQSSVSLHDFNVWDARLKDEKREVANNETSELEIYLSNKR